MLERRDNGYTAADGFRLLDYLGILKNLTTDEVREFNESWETMHKRFNDLIETTRGLYTLSLPILCLEDEKKSAKLYKLRDVEFRTRLEEKNLEQFLSYGIPLEQVLDVFENNAEAN